MSTEELESQLEQFRQMLLGGDGWLLEELSTNTSLANIYYIPLFLNIAPQDVIKNSFMEDWYSTTSTNPIVSSIETMNELLKFKSVYSTAFVVFQKFLKTEHETKDFELVIEICEQFVFSEHVHTKPVKDMRSFFREWALKPEDKIVVDATLHEMINSANKHRLVLQIDEEDENE